MVVLPGVRLIVLGAVGDAGVALSIWRVSSAAGLWLITPVTALACAALVLGYERQDMAQRFGSRATLSRVERALRESAS